MATRFRYFENYDDDELFDGARFRNPFNPKNPEFGNPWISEQTAATLKAELERRDLPTTGEKDELLKRLLQDNVELQTHRGAKERYQRKLADFKSATPGAVDTISFTIFPNIPTELQDLVWELSLPGSRVLSARANSISGIFDRSASFQFYRDENQPNPVALSVCRDSRRVALGKYRLCLGTHNIYADLKGEDILYFSKKSFSRIIEGGGGGGGPVWKPIAAIVAHINEVTRLAFGPDIWRVFISINAWGYGNCEGARLRKQLEGFPNLKEVFLLAGGSDIEGDLNDIPGYTEFSEVSEEATNEEEETISKLGVIKVEFECKDIDENTRTPIPKVVIRNADKRTNIPSHHADWYLGEPYYLPTATWVTSKDQTSGISQELAAAVISD